MSLDRLIQKPADRKPVITICGDAGLGKTSLAASFPKPIFIRAEDGVQAISSADRPDCMPVITKVEQLWEQLTALIKEDHEYQTLVVDSVTALERLFAAHIVATDDNNPKSINQACGGYGNGLKAVAELHCKLRNYCGHLNTRKNMSIVFIAHAETETLDLPDAEPYNRYSMRLNKQSIPVYLDDSDLVGYIKLESFVKKETKKAVSTGARVLVAHAEASSVAKNRYGIEKEITFKKGENPLSKFLNQPQHNTTEGK